MTKLPGITANSQKILNVVFMIKRRVVVFFQGLKTCSCLARDGCELVRPKSGLMSSEISSCVWSRHASDGHSEMKSLHPA